MLAPHLGALFTHGSGAEYTSEEGAELLAGSPVNTAPCPGGRELKNLRAAVPQGLSAVQHGYFPVKLCVCISVEGKL